MTQYTQEMITHFDDVRTLSPAHSPCILESWQRCMNTHQLDPTTLQKAVVLSSGELKDHQEQMDSLMHAARVGMEALYQQVRSVGYVVLLTNEVGVTVDFIGDRTFDNQLKKSGLYLGADWNEARGGTSAVGTSIAISQPITVHQTDHFDASHIGLTCSAAPIYAPNGTLAGVLDISALSSPQNKTSQHLALEMVRIYSERIERSYFLSHFKDNIILSLSKTPDFVEVAPDYLIAMNHAGKIIGFTHSVQKTLTNQQSILGKNIDQLLDHSLTELLSTKHLPSYQRFTCIQQTQQALFTHLHLPPKPPSTQSAVQQNETLLAHTHGGDQQLHKIDQRLSRLINSRVNIILGGETGTGKEFFAHAIHQASARADKPFVAINCAAIPESLIESELFGYEQGAFTGSQRGGKKGLIEKSNGGTLFLDEIGDMPLLLQSRLLRVLSEKELYPLGSAQKISLDLYVISATHQDLKQLIAKGLFRADLYYRLNGSAFVLPALRAREDFDWLVMRLSTELATDEGSVCFDAQAMTALKTYHWPGNIRELKNAIAYCTAMKPNGTIHASDLHDIFELSDDPIEGTAVQQTPHNIEEPPTKYPPVTTSQDEASRLHDTLKQCNWNVTETAKVLGLARMTVYRRMKRYQLLPPNRSSR